MKPAKILIVDDEPNISEVVTLTLKSEGYETLTVHSGLEALEALKTFKADLILLDVMMPGIDGFETAKRIQKSTPTALIFLSARDALEDKYKGFDTGSEDYITKPFSVNEVKARVKAVLRRTLGAKPSNSKLTFGDIELDEDTKEVTKNGELVNLSPTEFALLRYMLRNPRVTLSKTQIKDNVWGEDFQGETNVVESYISYLRKKVDTTEPQLIHTLRSVGYILRKPNK